MVNLDPIRREMILYVGSGKNTRGTIFF